MAKAVASSAEVRVPNRNDPGLEPAPAGISFFGISLARIVRIPLQRWQLTLALLALCTLTAVLNGAYFSKQTFKTFGRLVHRPPAEQPDIPAAKTIDTLIDEMKREHYYDQLNDKFSMGINPEMFVRFFSITKPTENSSIILVGLEWEDAKRGAELINALMQSFCDEVSSDRRKDLTRALKATQSTLADCVARLEKARKEAEVVIATEKKLDGTDPDKKLAALQVSIQDVEKLMRVGKSDQIVLTRKLKETQQEIERLTQELKDREAGKGKQEDAEADPDYKVKSAEIKRRLIDLEESLKKNLGEVADAKDDYDRKQGLYKRGTITITEWKAVVARLKRAESAVESDKRRLTLTQSDLRQLRPGFAALRGELVSARAELKRIKERQAAESTALQSLDNRLGGLMTDQQRVIEIHQKWYPKAEKVKLLEKEEQQIYAKQAELDRRLRAVAAELEISSAALPSNLPLSDRKKKTMMGFAIPLLAGLALMIGFSMTTRTWRFETLAERLQLPVLARASSGGLRRARPGDLTANECRALSLRIRQAVPESGQIVLLSSLNDGEGIERLVGDLSAYFAVRNEQVLILDARIARQKAEGLATLIEGRSGAAPVDTRIVAGAPQAGLVQSLVFDDQDCASFMHRTRIAGVDYLPAGGPYPVTDALASEPMNDLLESLRQRYTLILMVGPALSLAVDTEILAAYMDGMIVLLNEPLNSYTPAVEELMQYLKENGAPLLGSVICV